MIVSKKFNNTNDKVNNLSANMLQNPREHDIFEKLLHEVFPIPIPMCVPQRILVNFYCVLTMQQVLKKNDKGKGGVGKCTESRPRVRILLCWCYCTVL